MSWSRIGNFYAYGGNDHRSILYREIGKSRSTILHAVHFRSTARNALIRMIYVAFNSDKEIIVQLHSTVFSQDEIRDLLPKFFSKQNYEIIAGNLHIVDIKLESEDSLKKLIELFQYLNKKYEASLFSNDIIDELTKMYRFIHDSNRRVFLLNANKEIKTEYQHTISEYIQPYHEYTNPARYNSQELASILGPVSPHKFTKNYLKKLLISGENPNQYDSFGRPSIYHAILTHADLDVLELLLIYGADPYNLDSNVNFKNAFEATRELNKPDKFQLLTAAVTRAGKPLASNFTVIKENIYYENNILHTHLYFSNKKTIRSELKEVSQINQVEMRALFTLVSKSFKAQDDADLAKLLTIFFKDVTGQHKFIDIIRDGNNIIGFNLYKLFQLKKQKNTYVFHIDYALIEPAYRGYGLMYLLIFRAAYALQELFPDYKIAVFFSSIHWNSYRMVASDIDEVFLHFPMHQPDYMDKEFIGEILDEVFGKDNYQLFHLLMLCYIVEQIRVNEVGNNKASTNLMLKFYNKYLRGLEGEDTDEIRSVPIIFYIDRRNFEKITKVCANIGVDFPGHIKQLASSLQPFLSKMTNKQTEYKPSNHTSIISKIHPALQFFLRKSQTCNDNMTTPLNCNENNIKAQCRGKAKL